MKAIIIIVFFLTLFDSCNLATKNDNHDEKSYRREQLKTIHGLIRKVGFIKLPYSINLESLQDNYKVTYKLDYNSSDKILLEEGLHSDIIGFLPDTSNYYGILYYVHADMTLIQLMVYSKKGEIVTNRLVTDCNCSTFGGEIINCKDTTTIENNLSIKYFHESTIIVESKTKANSYDTIYKSIEKEESINKIGEIILTKSDTLIKQ